MVIKRPLRQNAATTADDPGQTALDLGQVLNQQAGVDGLVFNALLTVLPNDIELILPQPKMSFIFL